MRQHGGRGNCRLIVLATFAEFEGDLIRLRTREGMAIARAKGKLRGKQPKLSEKQQKELCRMHETGQYSISDLAELFSVSRPTAYRTLSRNHKCGSRNRLSCQPCKTARVSKPFTGHQAQRPVKPPKITSLSILIDSFPPFCFTPLCIFLLLFCILSLIRRYFLWGPVIYKEYMV